MSGSFGSPFGGGFDLVFNLFPFMFLIVFAIVIGSILFSGAKYVRNASSPRETVYARVVAKRMDVRTQVNHHSAAGGMHPHTHATHSSRTHYFITLEFDNGERREYLDTKQLYGLVVEGDEGYAAVQGDWIVAFERAPRRENGR